MTDNFSEYLETQELMNNLGETLKKLYEPDPTFDVEKELSDLTERTYEMIKYIEEMQIMLMQDKGVISTAEAYDTSKEVIVSDILEIFLMSTIARQKMHIEKLTKKED